MPKDLTHPYLVDRLTFFIINDTGCHIYQGSLDGGGYPLYTIGSKETLVNYRLHRAKLAIKLGKTYEEVNLACHTCNNRACINEDHLYNGSEKDNMQDSIKNGTHPSIDFKARTHCPYDHEYNDENTIYQYHPNGSIKSRKCRKCQVISNANRYKH